MRAMQGRKKPEVSRSLLARAQGGDEEAFADLVRATRPRLEILIHLRLGPALRRIVEPEDVLQETYLRAWRALPDFRYHNRTAVFKWFATLAEHVIAQLARYYLKTRRRPTPRGGNGRDPRPWVRPLGTEIWGLLPSLATNPAATLMREERFDRLEKALAKLKPEHRQVILLARVNELPTNECAERMGRTPEAVSMLLLRAVRRLREIFGDTGSWHLPAHRLAAWIPPEDKASPDNERAVSGGAPDGMD